MTFEIRKITLSSSVAALVLLSLVVQADHVSGGVGGGTSAITTESARTLAKGRFSISLRSELVELDDFTDAELKVLRERDEDADLHSVDSILGLSANLLYGVTDDFMVGFKVPYVSRSNIREPEHEHGHGHGGGGEIEIVHLGDVEGIGDLSMFGQYRFLGDRETRHASVLLGVKAPTGEDDEQHGDETLETELQPGTGSWDGLFGIAYSQIYERFTFASSLLYTIVTEGDQDTDTGDILGYNFALSYRLNGAPGPLGAPREAHSWDLVLELNGEWRDKEQAHGETDGNSGGNLVFISPGVRFNSRWNWVVSTAAGFPIVADLNGYQVEPDFRLISNFTLDF